MTPMHHAATGDSALVQTLIECKADVNILDYEDRNTCILFGDGAGATLIEINPERTPLSDLADFSFQAKSGELLPQPSALNALT